MKAPPPWLRTKPATPLAFTSAVLLAGCNGTEPAIAPVEVARVPLTGDTLLDALLQGSKYVSDAPLRFAISPGIDVDQLPIDVDAERAAMNEAFAEIEAYTGLRFEDTGVFDSFEAARAAGATIVLMSDREQWFYRDPEDATWIAATAFSPDTDGAARGLDYAINGILVLNQTVWSDDAEDTPIPGTYAFSVRLHELGHVVGLKHPHDDGGTGRPTFEDIGFEGFDDYQYTLMSYNNLLGANAEGGYLNNPQTYMPLDILAMMHLYGINENTNSGDNVYLVETTSTRTSIWDAGGTDTIDASLVVQDLDIRLPDTYPMERVDIALGWVENITALVDPFILWLLGDIENAYGGSGDDDIVGNALDNRLVGGNGNDILSGLGGDDLLVGGGGADIFVLSLGGGTDRIVDLEPGVDAIVFAGEGGLASDAPTPEATLGADADGNATYSLADGAMIIVESIDPSAFALVA